MQYLVLMVIRGHRTHLGQNCGPVALGWMQAPVAAASNSCCLFSAACRGLTTGASTATVLLRQTQGPGPAGKWRQAPSRGCSGKLQFLHSEAK